MIQDNSSFKKLSEKEILSTIVILADNLNLQFVVWKSNAPKKSLTKILKVNNRVIELKSIELNENLKISDQLLFFFKIQSQLFFGKSNIVKLENNLITINIDHLYKLERRDYFRLTLFPNRSNFLELKFTQIKNNKNDSRILNFSKKINQTRLFKNFLEIIGKPAISDQHVIYRFRVYDLSLSGLSLIIFNKSEEQLFNSIETIQRATLLIDQASISINEIKVIYQTQNNEINELNPVRIGIEFIDFENSFQKSVFDYINNNYNKWDDHFEEILDN